MNMPAAKTYDLFVEVYPIATKLTRANPEIPTVEYPSCQPPSPGSDKDAQNLSSNLHL